MSKISLKHSGGNVVSLNAPTNAPSAADVAFKLPNTDGSDGQAIVTDGSGNLSFSSVAATRNLIINGACQVAQRSNLVNAQTGYGAVDRFKLQSTGASRFTLSKGNGPGAQYGLPSALKFETTTADDSVAAGDYMYIDTKFEGQDLQRFQKGSSDAKQFTLQFWIKLAVQGTYVVQLFDADNSRHVVANYTVSSPNTWEKKIITFPADTSGVLDSDNQKSFEVRWHFLGGSTYRGGTQQTTWGSIVAANMLEGMGNAVSATGDNFISGMQLEVGSVATDFEHRSFADELLKCQRYYYRVGLNQGIYYGGDIGFGLTDNDNDSCNIVTNFQTQMRIAPTAVEHTGSASDYKVRVTTTQTCDNVPVFISATAWLGKTNFRKGSHNYGTAVPVFAQTANSNSFLAWSAEL